MSIEIFIIIAFLICIGAYFFLRKGNSPKSKAINQSPRDINKDKANTTATKNTSSDLSSNTATTAKSGNISKTGNGFDNALSKILNSDYKDSDATEEDRNIIRQLHEAGSNFNKPHELEFFFSLSDELSANQLADKFKPSGFNAYVNSPDKGKNWICKVVTKMTPNAGKISALGKHFTEIAKNHQGKYNGWETNLEK